MQDRNRTIRNLIIFAVSVLGLAALSGFIEPYTLPPGSAPGTAGFGQLLWILAPLSVSLLLRAFGGSGWSDFGLQPNFKGNSFWWWVSLLVFPLLVMIVVLVGALFGGITINSSMFPVFTTALLAGFIPALIKNIFEEFAWRGYLAPNVYSLHLNIWLSHAIIGIIWGAWHLPFVFVFYGEIRLATNSVLPAWIMHAIGNTLGSALLLTNFIHLSSGQELLFSPGAESVVSIVLTFVIGYWLHQQRKNNIPG